jgi:hypothetical protein
MANGDHRSAVSLAEVVRLVREMNPSGTRRFSPTMILESLSEMKA